MSDKAWRCWIPRYDGNPDDDETCGLFMATTRSKAKYQAWANWEDVLTGLTLFDMRARRAPEHDNSVFNDGEMPKYAKRGAP